MTLKPAIFSFFTGAGFLDLGFETNGYTTAFVNELYQPFLDAYKYSRTKLLIPDPLFGHSSDSVEVFFNGEHNNFLNTSMKEIKSKSYLVGFIAGPPCPDFSVGGKNRGRTGDKGRLTYVYMNLICQLLPDFFLFENVKGLWKTKKHREFYEEVKRLVRQNGYITTEKLINTIDYATPQDRERIVLLGFRKDLLIDLGILRSNYISSFLSEGIFPWRKYARFSKPELDDLPWPNTTPFIENSILPFPGNVPIELTVENWFRKNNVENHPNAVHFFKPRAGLRRFQTIPEGDDSKKSFKRLHRWRYSPTAAYGNNEVHLHPYKARRITASEALAIQSLPSGYELPESMSLSSMFKTIGNGVPYLAASALALSILSFLEGKNEIDRN